METGKKCSRRVKESIPGELEKGTKIPLQIKRLLYHLISVEIASLQHYNSLK